jgi:hypothetical protein
MTKYLFLAGLDVLPPVCMGCGSPIHDQFILRVSPDLSWHAACLKVSFSKSNQSCLGMLPALRLVRSH